MSSRKHELSPAPLPPAKRLHTTTMARRVEARHILTFENSIYDELVLCVFSHLSWMDLCVAQSINKNWARLAGDNELWRRQYLQVFGRPRLRGAKGFVGSRPDGRETKPLPGRAQADGAKDWKWMFRISSNWRRGRCRVENLFSCPPPESASAPPPTYHTSILVAGRLTITASSQSSGRPEIQITGNSNDERFTISCESQLADKSHITTLALDQSPPTAGQLRVASFLSTGEFDVWSLSHARPATRTRQCAYRPARTSDRTSPIIQAVYHHPLLVTLSRSFSLSIYDLSTGTVRHSQTLTSFTSFPPSSLVLSTPSPSSFKLVLAYAIPVYPAHWSVGATELIIGGSGSTFQNSATAALGFSSDTPSPGLETMAVRSTRTIRSIDVPHGWVDERKLRVMREQWGRKVSQITDTQTDGKWVVLAPGDRLSHLQESSSPQDQSSPSPAPPFPESTSMISSPMHSAFGLQLYRLTLPSQSPSVSASQPKLTFVRTLHGQVGPITAMALADGRCVSLGYNGSIWVWDLENGTGAEVAASGFSARDALPESVKGSVVFDEKRIISTLGGNVAVRRFDI